MAKPAKVHTIESLLANTVEEGECLIWQGSIGYGNVPQVYVKGRGVIPVRRLILDLQGKERRGPFAGVSCGCSHCVAPGHIVDRNQREQAKVMAKKAHTTGKAAHRIGVTVWRHANPLKLDMDKARAIRMDQRPSRAIAQDYGIDKSLVCRIKAGGAWREATNPFSGLL